MIMRGICINVPGFAIPDEDIYVIVCIHSIRENLFALEVGAWEGQVAEDEFASCEERVD